MGAPAYKTGMPKGLKSLIHDLQEVGRGSGTPARPATRYSYHTHSDKAERLTRDGRHANGVDQAYSIVVVVFLENTMAEPQHQAASGGLEGGAHMPEGAARHLIFGEGAEGRGRAGTREGRL